jgi:hypothetical protein
MLQTFFAPEPEKLSERPRGFHLNANERHQGKSISHQHFVKQAKVTSLSATRELCGRNERSSPHLDSKVNEEGTY